MASTGGNTTQSDTGLPSKPPTTSKKRTYADVLKSSELLESNIRLQQINRCLHAALQNPHFQLEQSDGSLRTSPHAPHFQLSRDLESAAHQVFRTPELLGMILSNLPLVSDRNALRVSKQFWEVLNPNAERHLSGIKQALGLDFSRSVESLTDKETADLWGHKFILLHTPEPRLDWLVNFELDLTYVYSRHAPFLKIWPFVFESKIGCLKCGRLEISLRLDADDIDRDYTDPKGVYATSKDRETLYSNERGSVSRNWMDVKLVNLPFKVLVSVGVDFRKCMGAPSHHEGVCRVPGCQVGLFGVQRTSTNLAPEKATMGEFIAFLDLVEHDARNIAATIATRSDRFGPGLHGENYYLGSSVAPPTLTSQYTGDYTIHASHFQPSRMTLEQMTPRSLREILFPKGSVSK